MKPTKRLKDQLKKGPNQVRVPVRDVGLEAEAAAGNLASQPVKLNILCDNCHQEVSPSQEQKRLKKGFFEVGIVCPLCGFWVHSYYSNAELELAQRILESFKKCSTRSLKDRQRYHLKIAEFRRQHQKVQDRVGRMVKNGAA